MALLGVVQELILETLHFCLMINMEDALNSGAMEVFTQLLVHESPVIRAKAARDIKDLRYFMFQLIIYWQMHK